jgi:iron(III) transport system ATP-binding protein
MNALELIEVDKRYGRTPVVRALSLTVAEGELVALLGPSGCGKTTTLRLISGLERVDGGVIRIAGQVADDGSTFLAPEKRALAIVFQSYAVWPHLSVFDNVAYPLVIAKAPQVASRVKEALGWVRMSSFADRQPHQLSGGQLQRIALARALVARPRVLLLDEPLSSLDLGLREELRGEIASLRARLGTTMILVTHDQVEALALADRVAVMNAGLVEQFDSPQRLYREPKTPFVAGFVGGSNLLHGQLESGTFVTEGFRFAVPLKTGPTTVSLSIRPEDIEIGAQGTVLTLEARLFLGHLTEYRFRLGSGVLRAIGPAIDGIRPGNTAQIRFRRVRVFDGTEALEAWSG